MTSQSTFTTYGTDLENLLLLRTHPIAIKMLKSEDEVPQGAIRPKRDRGEHWAICQVFSLARRQGRRSPCSSKITGATRQSSRTASWNRPQDYLDGFTHSFFIADKESAASTPRRSDALPVGQYAGDGRRPHWPEPTSSPTWSMIYCTPAQLTAPAARPALPARHRGDVDARSHRVVHPLGGALASDG